MRTLCVIVLYLFHFSLSAQFIRTDTKETAVAKETKVIKVRRTNNCFGIELTNLNVMYLNIDNPFKVVYSGSGKVKVKLSNGTATDLGNGKFCANIKDGNETAISIYEVNGKVEKAIGTRVYRLLPVPKPMATIAGIESGGTISKALLIAANGINIVLKGFLYDVKYEVVSYSVTINTGGEFKTASSIGAFYSRDTIGIIQKLKNNSRVIFEDIRVRLTGTSIILSIAPITLSVSG